MESLVNAEGVSYQYPGPSGPVDALWDINIYIEPGEHIAILGPNGSGKSTLLKHFNALLVPTVGRVKFRGKDTADSEQVWEIRRECGMVFQNPDNQLVATTVEEEVAFGLENLSLPPPEIRTRVEEALRTMDLTEWAGHAPHLLSGGQKQRVALAGVMAMRPRCLLLDEPTALLDKKGKSEVMETALRLNREEGVAVLHVTHFLEEAALADRVVVLNQGRLVQDAPAAEVLSNGVRIQEWGLELPPAARLADCLRSRGVPLPQRIITMEQLVDIICSWKRKV